MQTVVIRAYACSPVDELLCLGRVAYAHPGLRGAQLGIDVLGIGVGVAGVGIRSLILHAREFIGVSKIGEQVGLLRRRAFQSSNRSGIIPRFALEIGNRAEDIDVVGIATASHVEQLLGARG